MTAKQVVLHNVSRKELDKIIESKVREGIERAMQPEWVDKHDAMDLLGISESTLQRLRDRKAIKYSQDGRRIMYHRQSLLDYLERNAVGGDQ